MREIDKKLNREGKVGFWELKTLKLEEFHPGIWTRIKSGKNSAILSLFLTLSIILFISFRHK